jgi:hypothetical protein
MKGTGIILLEQPQPRTHCIIIQFKRTVIEKTKANGRSMVESTIQKGKEMLIASTFPLPLIAMVSRLEMRSCILHIKN